MNKYLTIVIITILSISCKERTGTYVTPESSFDNLPLPDFNNADILLPKNFGSILVTEGVGNRARHIVIADNGDIYVKMQQLVKGKGIVALRDDDGDGKSDIIESFANYIGTGIDIYKGFLYASSTTAIYRYELNDTDLIPHSEEIIVTNFPVQNDHNSKTFTFDNDNNIYINVGAPSNACQESPRSPGSMGIDPCPQLEEQAGIWQYASNKLKQKHPSDGSIYASGIRNAVALDWNSHVNSLYALQHGRDQLYQLWPSIYSQEESAELPAEEFLQIDKNDNFGWPYCYYDHLQGKRILAPEYGGNSKIQGKCSDFKAPILGFPGHLAPNDLLFYQGNQFPKKYKNGAFVAFHGSWNRAPLPQSGFFVAFIPMKDGKVNGKWEIFADSFSGMQEVENPGDAKDRPMGLAEGPDGSLYVTSSVTGKIWRIMYYGEKSGIAKTIINDATDIYQTELDKNDVSLGKKVYDTYCLACHQSDGRGVQGLNPPLTENEWIRGDKNRLINVVLKGMSGEKVNGENYNNIMAPHEFLSDTEIAEVLTFVRTNFGNSFEPISEEEVRLVRSSL